MKLDADAKSGLIFFGFVAFAALWAWLAWRDSRSSS